MGISKKDIGYAIAWVAVYFCRVVLLTNGIIYAISGCAYIDSTYTALRVYGNATLQVFPQVDGVLTDEFIKSQNGGLVILGSFMGAAYASCGFTSLAAGLFFANFESGAVMLLDTTLLSLIGNIVRPDMPKEVYVGDAQGKVQSSQLLATGMGLAGVFTMVGGMAIAALLGYEGVPTPVQYAKVLFDKFRNKPAPTASSIGESSAALEVGATGGAISMVGGKGAENL